ncbi:hypothetical protein POTOM_038352 [Populus tomentosa]|uniref:Aspartate/glutamate/uridylate kinase domain-containing protein n=1 Tax=Populus tomentosa TaxID=118781 RepID=A0A8X8CL98_POPTO|nr:hypothetical protein POTOM_038352 [Populus tomentosa]
MEDTTTLSVTKPIRCIVKLGGAAITCKNDLEKINEENVEIVSSQLREAMITGSSSRKVLGMDWSKRPGKSGISCDADDFEDQNLDSSSFVVVHGAGVGLQSDVHSLLVKICDADLLFLPSGSFGHFQASKSGVHKGGLNKPLVKAGFVATRISVTTLNLEIVRALAREGIPSIGMSPFSCGWTTSERNMASADLSMVAQAINSGFVPVLHGDAVLDDLQGCTILSGDVIIRHLAAYLKPEYVVFLTDVLGVYDRPPSEPNAVLLREIAVSEDGSWSVVKPTLEDMKKQVETTVAAHDTTGGMATKISEAALIAKLGIDVYIVKAATTHSSRALSGEVKGALPEDWLGTVIRFVGKGNRNC